jgi:hypothetical protein
MSGWEAWLGKGFTQNDEDFICITDIARYKDADGMDDLIRNWLRNRKKTLAIIRVHSRLIMRTTDGIDGEPLMNANEHELLFKDEVYTIIGAAMDVSRELGIGCYLNELVRYTFVNRLLQRSELDKKKVLPFMLIYSESK